MGDALHTVLCAAGYNLRWLLRAVLRGRIRRLFFAFWSATLQVLLAVSEMLASLDTRWARKTWLLPRTQRWLPADAATTG